MSSCLPASERGRVSERGEGEDPEGQHQPAGVPDVPPRWRLRAGADLGARRGPSQLPQAVRPP